MGTVIDTSGGGGNDEPQEPSGNSGSSSDTDSAPASSSAPSGPPPPTEAEQRAEALERQRMAMLQSVYSQIWGEPATEAYLRKAVNQGLNIWEFAFRERQKPAYFGSKPYKDKADEYASLIHSMGAA